MSYDIRLGVKVEGGDNLFAVIAEPRLDSPTYNLGTMFRECTSWDFEQAPLVFIGVCKFKDGAFGFSKQRAGIEEFTAFSSTTYNVEFEIIGNIHDNADLLIIK